MTDTEQATKNTEAKTEDSSKEGERDTASPQASASNVAESKQTGEVTPTLVAKHPLQYRWTLWFCKSDRTKSWEQCLKMVATFDTVEDFWALYNHIQLPTGLTNGCDYYLFKDKIVPMWEAEGNKGGGRWLIKLDRQHNRNVPEELLDHYWLELVMAMIGEQFEDLSHSICGAVVNVRNKGDKVSLWTRDCQKDEANRRIGEIVKQKLGLEEHIYYEAHQDAKSKQSSNIKHTLFV